MASIDALAGATELKMADVELLAARYRGRRGLEHARASLDLVDAGAQSPKETWLRLVLVQAGLPRPQTQIPVIDEFGCVIGYLDMGWDDVKVAVEYDGITTAAIARNTTGISGDWKDYGAGGGSWSEW